MKILLVAATKQEIQPFWKRYSEHTSAFLHEIEILITGAGMVKTTFALSQVLCKNKYDLVINVGIAGSFQKKIPLGTLVNVTYDIFSELGAEDGNSFVDFVESGLLKKEDIYTRSQNAVFLHPLINNLPEVTGITVNTVHGNEESILAVRKRFSPQVESMEGAAIFYVCKEFNANCIQLRTISNYIEKRDTKAWNIPLAIDNLNAFLVQLLSKDEGLNH